MRVVSSWIVFVSCLGLCVAGAATPWDSWEDYLAAAAAKLAAGDAEEAANLYAPALEEMQAFERADPLLRRAATGYALALIELDRDEEAMQPFEQGILVDLDFPADALRTLAVAATRVGRELHQSSIGIDAEHGNAERSSVVLRVALKIHEHLGGPESVDVERLLLDLADSLMLHGDREERVALVRRAVVMREKRLGADDIRMTEVLLQLAQVLDHSDPEAAWEVRLRFVDLYLEHYADDPQRLHVAYRMMADHYESQRDEERFRHWNALAEEAYLASLPEEHRESSSFLVFRAITAEQAGDLERAEGLFLRAAAVSRIEAEEDPRKPFYAITHAATWYMRQEQHDRAEELFSESLTLGEALLETDPVFYLSALTNYSYLWKERGDLDKALDYRLRSVELAARINLETEAGSYSGLSDLYLRRGEFESALEVGLKSLALHEEVFGPEHLMTTNATRRVADAYLALGHKEQAREYLQHTLEIRERVMGATNSTVEGLRREIERLARETDRDAKRRR